MKHFQEINAVIFVSIINKLVGELFLKTVGHTIEYQKFDETIGYYDNDKKLFFISSLYLS